MHVILTCNYFLACHSMFAELRRYWFWKPSKTCMHCCSGLQRDSSTITVETARSPCVWMPALIHTLWWVPAGGVQRPDSWRSELALWIRMQEIMGLKYESWFLFYMILIHNFCITFAALGCYIIEIGCYLFWKYHLNTLLTLILCHNLPPHLT